MASPGAVEHLVLSWVSTAFTGGHYKTRYHENLGPDLQTALEALEAEGWEAGFAFGLTEIVLKRPRPEPR